MLAYHYLTTGNKDPAASQLKQLYMQMPQDKVITELLGMAAGPKPLAAVSTAATNTKPSAPVIASPDLFSARGAAGQDKTMFALEELTKEGNFNWTYTQGGKAQTVKGVYALDENVLAMEPESGGVMLAEITPPKGGSFDFQLLGAPPGDSGLKFVKSR